MVSEIAGRIPRHVCRTDLVSAGMAGLAQAAKSYQPDRGVTFQRFASSRIRGAILDELRARDWASRSVRAKARDLAQTTDQLTARLGRQPSTAEVATAMGASSEELDAINTDVYRALVLNLDALPVEGKNEESLFSGTSAPDEDVLDNEKRAYLVAAVDSLPERLRRVVVGYFFEELPMQALAEELGVTDSRISQMRAEALVLNLDALPVEGKSEESLFSGTSAPDEDILDNEKRAYLVAAVDSLPERLRRVVVGYFFEELPMQALAEELGVTDSRISQMRAEALVLLRDAINAQLDPDLVPAEPSERVAKRRYAYYAAVAAHDDYRRRLDPAAGQLSSLAKRNDLAALA
jgi:RNA polymerase sigma factor for flagellar operon FliA